MKTFFQGKYAKDHWSMNIVDNKDPHFLFLWQKKSNCPQIVAILNPTDARGCRALVNLVDYGDMAQSVNRPFSNEERKELNEAVSLLAQVYREIFPIVQIMELGNNAHHLDANGQVVLGTASEPCMLHNHIVARGNPLTCYIPDVPLGGPHPSEQFDMRGPKVPWTKETLEKCSREIRSRLEKYSAPITIGFSL
jgi:hypothetical protein